MIGLVLGSVHAANFLLGPMLGHVDETSAQIWCGLDSEGTASLKVSEREDLRGARVITATFERGAISIDELKPGTTYYYQVLANRYSKSAICQFRTVSPQPEGGVLRVLFSSCSGHTGYDEANTWDAISELDSLDLMLMLGDSHYADTTNPEVIAKHYLSHRAVRGFRDATSHVPTYGIWDDHDYGPNNSDGQTAGKTGSLATFKRHWANPGYGELDNPGVYFSFSRGDVQVIMLDSRYYRTPNTSMKADSPDKVLLGNRQLAWLEHSLRGSTAKIKLVACGSEFQRQGSSDGFSGFRVEQQKVLDLVKQVEGVILLSGDRHFTAGYQIRGETIEITSGPLGSGNARPRPTPDTIFAANSGKMFSVLEVDTRGAAPVVRWEVHQTGKGVIHDSIFSWEQINGLQDMR
jgi:alkaline phosphatase D